MTARSPRRIGRWSYFHHPDNGPVWRLDGTTLDLEHDLSCHSVCSGGRCNGAWVLYRDGQYVLPVSEHLESAMEWVERTDDETRRKALRLNSITCDDLTRALQALAERTGNSSAYYPALATRIFEHVWEQITPEETLAALAGRARGGFSVPLSQIQEGNST